MDNKTIKIVVAGVGGVGGYFGGLLAKQYADDKSVEIIFYSRGAHLQHIHAHGLTVADHDKTFVAKPDLATDNSDLIGNADFILVSTKAYHLNTIMEELASCITPETVILPLLNGVNHSEFIAERYPHTLVLQGCVYIIVRKDAPGHIEKSSAVARFIFGSKRGPDERLDRLLQILKDAGIDAHYPPEIDSVIWEKFIFISAIATATSYFDVSRGGIMNDENKHKDTALLVDEIIALAAFKNIDLPADIKEKTLLKLEWMPDDSTSSMHTDFQNPGHENELEALTGYVVSESKRAGLQSETYFKMYESLRKR